MLGKSLKKSYQWVLGRLTVFAFPSSNTTISPCLCATKLPQKCPHNAVIVSAGNKGKTRATIAEPVNFLRGRTLGKSMSMVLKESPNSLTTSSKHVVIVMDALKEFSMDPLQWALDHVVAVGYTITLLGVMPWLNLPLSCKTWLDVWALDLEDLPALRQRSEWTSDAKYQKVRGIIELCDKYGVVPQMKVAMGYPPRLLVLEKTTSLHATWVVFDRHHRKNRAFYAERILCNVVMMNSEGEMDIIRTRPMINKGDTTPSTSTGTQSESPSPLPMVPKVIISDKLKGILRPIKEQSYEDEEYLDYVI